jgi:hypothetical protein
MLSRVLMSSGLILLSGLAQAGTRTVVMESSIDLATGQRISADSRPKHSKFRGRYFQRTEFAMTEPAELVKVVGGQEYTGDPDDGPQTPLCRTVSVFRLGTYITQLYNEDTGALLATKKGLVNARVDEIRVDEPGCPPRPSRNLANADVTAKDFYNQPLTVDVQQGVRVSTHLMTNFGAGSIVDGRLQGFQFSRQPALTVHWFVYDPTLGEPAVYDEMVSGDSPLQLTER